MKKAADRSEFGDPECSPAFEAGFEIVDAEVGGLCDTVDGRTVVFDRLGDDRCEANSS